MKAPRAVRLAAALWIVLPFVVWNVIFDRTLVLAGRRYSHAATVAARRGGAYVRIDDWMRPAVARGATTATGVALLVAAFGLSAVASAARRERRTQRLRSGGERRFHTGA